ncbi:MAG: DUF368 domain-containing protein [Planctomycetota bacterium]|nr:MAG: DUF368 domain-containing protein [Planctomycetota bacterium]REJ97605.1 MAG: DUF368 domain-containing protein [Planctomycetota bacterium]REK23027.1 MAG: DUF368 domain-containing protein [Planctomycetota bacterium]REK43390.1 MAG: DUF368 domain-containing protein [Planctomycetota bacterium]
METEEPQRNRDAAHVACGMIMGGADIIPGVSGGTMALILGIYERLVAAVSRFDTELLGLVRNRQWRAAADHIDLRFLIALGCGIGLGVVVLGSLMQWLLDKGPYVRITCPLTISAFFGLIVASAIHVARLIPRWNLGAIGLAVLGVVIAYRITGGEESESVAGFGYLFLCGMIAICAMILPGISGSFIMVLLGVYKIITGAISDTQTAVRGFDFGPELLGNLATLAVFAAGCAIGILAFSKILNWLLKHYHTPTLALLCGFMIGSLRALWPFQFENSEFPALEYEGRNRALSEWLPAVLRERLDPEWIPTNLLVPGELTPLVWGCLATAVAAMLFVLALEWISTRGRRVEED